MKAPKLSETFVKAIQLAYKRRGLRALLPWWFATCFGVPIFLVWQSAGLIETELAMNKGIHTVFAAFLVLGGFLGAVSINVMREVYSLVSEPKFADYLREEGLFDQYIFWPQFVLIVQMSFIVAAVICTTLVVLAPLKGAVLYFLAVTIGLLGYSMSKTLGLIDMVRTLAWHRSDYQKQYDEELRKAQAQNSH